MEIKFDEEEESHKRSKLFNIDEMKKDHEGEDINEAPRKVKNIDKLFEKL